MADVAQALARALLGLGLVAALAANTLALWPPLAARLPRTRPLFAAASILLMAGTLALTWLHQRLTGDAWPWGSAAGWSLAVLLALWGSTQARGRARTGWLAAGIVAGLVALARLAVAA